MSQLVRYKTFVYDSARWEGFEFRPGDIVISTPPKCGTTWTQRICALLIFQTPELDRPLATISPWLDMLTRDLASVRADLAAQQHRRFIKTHTPLDGLPWDERVTYVTVGRDPRDVALSWDGHVTNLNAMALFSARETAVGNDDIAELLEEGPRPMAETEAGRFWEWVENAEPASEAPSSLLATLHHFETFWSQRRRPNVVLLHYQDMKRDLEGQMRSLARRLGIEVEESLWPALAAAAGFESMKRDADKFVPGATESIWQDNSRFFRSGKSGEWRALVAAEDMPRYDARVSELAAADLAAWAHHGEAGTRR